MADLDPQAWLDAARRTMRWLAAHLRDDGTWTHSRDAGAYFKSIAAFVAHGMLPEAQRCLNYLAGHLLTSDGDIRNSAAGKSDESVYELHADTYFNYLVALGAWRLMRFDVALPVIEHLAGRQVEQTGGFLIQRRGADPDGQQDIFSTAGGTVAMLIAGRFDRALHGSEWLLSLLRRQAGAKTLYVRTDGRGELVQEFPQSDQKRYQLDPTRAEQMYVLPGTAAAVLTWVYQATGKTEFLKAAQEYLEQWTDERIFQGSTQCCKHGWAAGLLWSITAQQRYRQMVGRAAQSLIRLQNDQGYWPFADLSWSFRYAFNAELAYWLIEYARLVEPACR